MPRFTKLAVEIFRHLAVGFTIFSLLTACGSEQRINNNFNNTTLECGEAFSEAYLRVAKQDGVGFYQGHEISVYGWGPQMKTVKEIQPTELGCIRQTQLVDSSLVLIRNQANLARVITTSEAIETSTIELRSTPAVRPEKNCGARYITSDRIDARSYLSNDGMDLMWLPFYSLSGRIQSTEGSQSSLIKEFPERLLISDEQWSLENVAAGAYKFQLVIKDYVHGGELRELSCDIETTPINLKVRAADQIKKYKTFFDREFGVVEPGYTVNFYIEGAVKNVEIEYCVQKIDPRNAELAEISCPTNQALSWLKDDSILLNEPGFYEIRHRSLKDELKSDWIKTGIMIDKRCSGNFEAVEPLAEQQCTELLGNLNLKSIRNSSRLQLDYLSEISGELQITNSSYQTIAAPNLNRVAKLNIRNNPELYSLEMKQLNQVATDIEIFSNPKIESLPDFSALRFVGGLLWIYENASLQSLQGFNRLTSLRSLIIHRNKALNEVSGLTNLAHLDLGISFNDNPALASIAGLRAVKTVNGSLDLQNNPSLENLDGLQNIEQIGESLNIVRMKFVSPDLSFVKLQSIGNDLALGYLEGFERLNSFQSLSKIGGSLKIFYNPDLSEVVLPPMTVITDRIEIQKNPSLTSVTSLGNTSELFGPIMINENPSLTDLSGFQSLKSILAGDLMIQKNEALTTLDGFENLAAINGSLSIGGNSSLQTLEGLRTLKKLSMLSLTDNPMLSSIAAFSNLSGLSDLVLYRNHSLTDLDGFTVPETMEGRIDIVGNEKLEALTALTTLKKLEGKLNLSGNLALNDLSALKQLEALGELEIRNSRALSDLSGFDSLQSVANHFMVINNENIKILDGFNRLTEVGGSFYLGANSAVEAITGFAELAAVNGRYLHIDSLPSLIKIQGFQKLTTIVGDFKITQNPKLKDISGFGQLRDIGKSLVIDSPDIVATSCPTHADVHNLLNEFCSNLQP
ncbi:MAG: hypothetical protein ACOH5I_20070 [Oligoflexus sp.]